MLATGMAIPSPTREDLRKNFRRVLARSVVRFDDGTHAPGQEPMAVVEADAPPRNAGLARLPGAVAGRETRRPRARGGPSGTRQHRSTPRAAHPNRAAAERHVLSEDEGHAVLGVVGSAANHQRVLVGGRECLRPHISDRPASHRRQHRVHRGGGWRRVEDDRRRPVLDAHQRSAIVAGVGGAGTRPGQSQYRPVRNWRAALYE